MSETKKFEIEFTELCDEYEVEVANFNEFYNKVVALAIQVQAPVSPKMATRKIEVITTSKYFEDFTAKTDIEILQVDVKAVEQSYMCQESFLAVIQYREC
jgi:hypothetical protein